MSRRQDERAWKLTEYPRFRAAYDLLELRAGAKNNSKLQCLTKWWDEFQAAAPLEQKDMLNDFGDDPIPRRRYRRPRKYTPCQGNA